MGTQKCFILANHPSRIVSSPFRPFGNWSSRRSISSSSSLKDVSSTFSEQLKEDIENAYSSVKLTKAFLIIFAIFSLLVTIFCGVMNIILLYRIYKEDDLTLFQILEQSKENGNIVSNDNGLDEPKFNINPPDVQENLYIPN